MRETVRFLMGGEIREIANPDPTMTVLDYLRGAACRPGTKEGCAEGDCGACTVVLGELADEGVSEDGDGPGNNAMRYRAVNACIQFVPMLDGKELITVEDLARRGHASRGDVNGGGDANDGSHEDAGLHPVQAALASGHASQCGFCTPGFVMSLYGALEGALEDARAEPGTLTRPLTRDDFKTVLAGNLCRCTGYGPILDGALAAQDAVQNGPDTDAARAASRAALVDFSRDETLGYDLSGCGGADVGEGEGAGEAPTASRRFSAPRTIEMLVAELAANPHAHIVAGLTDVGLWVTKAHRRLDTLISIGRIAELKTIIEDGSERPGWIDIGAGVTLSEVHAVLARHYPALDELIRRFASVQIRNVATLGGNIANGSPIGDMAPALIALGACLVLNGPEGQREIALEDFFIDYGKQDLRPSEFVERVLVPVASDAEDTRYACWKISKRFEQDISAVCAAFFVRFDGEAVAEARLAFGGMAGTPKRAVGAEAALVGQPWSEATIRTAMAALDDDFTPLDDMRASAHYRSLSACNLLLKFYLQAIDSKGISEFEIARGVSVNVS